MTADAQIDKAEPESKIIPKLIPLDRESLSKETKREITPEALEKDDSMLDKLPTPTGYRILILPFSRKSVSKGGIHLAEVYLEKERLATNVGFVVSLGEDAYKDERKYPNGPWCKERDWVIFGRYAGSRIKIDGGDLRLLNDDEILAVVEEPQDVD